MLSFRTYSKDLSTRWIYLRVWLCVKLNLRSILHNGQRRLLASIMLWMARKFIPYLLEQILTIPPLLRLSRRERNRIAANCFLLGLTGKEKAVK